MHRTARFPRQQRTGPAHGGAFRPGPGTTMQARANTSPTVQRLATLALRGAQVVQLKRLDEKLNDGDKKVAIVGETHGAVDPTKETQVFAGRGIELRYEADDIAVHDGVQDADAPRVTPDHAGWRLMFIATTAAEFIKDLENKVYANDGSYTVSAQDKTNANAVFPRLTGEAKNVRKLLRAAQSDAGQPEIHLTLEILDELMAARSAFRAAWKAAGNAPKTLTPDLIRTPLRSIVDVIGRMEEQMGSVQGVSIMPSSDYSLVRASHMYRVASGLAATRSNLIYKVGDSHVTEIRQIIDTVSPDVELLDAGQYVRELFDLLDVVSPQTRDNRAGGDAY
ncbi:hypothetical protein [uncultured Roseobacter sp.]|uniref:hypothetical protein n=1 Tax=uncultured Roseobacter sp. TaxID=114847 RepID=UPI00262311E5|nr:hypothetical protein [uncultured Roseobacter sp.]